MPSPARLAVVAVLAVLLSTFAFSQAPSAQPVATEQQAREQHGLAALREAVAQSQSLNLPANRIFLETTAAELLWTRDETLARSLVSNVRTRYRELATQTGTDRSRDQMAQQAFAHRRELAMAMARTDPQFALDFIHATAPPAQLSFSGNWENEIELGVAAAAAQSNPKLAASLVRQNMNAVNSYSVANTVEQIWNKDHATGAQLASEMISRLSNANFASDQQALMTATQVLQFYGNRVRLQQTAARNPRAPAPPPAILSDAQVQALAQAIYSAAQKPEFPSNWLPSVQNVMPQIQALVPSAMPLRGGQQAPSATFWNDLNTLVQKGNLDQAMAVATNAPPEYRMAAVQNIAMQVAGTGNIESAREMLSHSDIPEAQRQQIYDQLNSSAAMGVANRGAFEQARAMADLIRYNNERAQAYVQIAYAALNKNDKAMAATLLNDARAMVSNPPADAGEMNTLVQIANAYVQLEPARSAEILAGLVDLINEKLPAVAITDGFVNGWMRSFYNGEMVLQEGNAIQLLAPAQGMLATLANVDFDRAMDIAAKLQRPEAKVMAYLGIARMLLGGGGGYGAGYGRGMVFGRGGFMVH